MATAPTPPGLGARSAGLNAHYGLGAPPKPAPVRTPRPKQTGAAALPTDPLQPLSGAQIANTIAGYTAGMPAPLTDQQIRLRAQGMLDPLVQQLTSRYGNLTKAGAGAISGYANELAKNLGSYQGSASQIYGGAEQQQAATDSALASQTQGAGLEQANQLSGLLTSIGADQPNVAQATAGQVAQNAQGAAGAVLGTGSASLSQLIGEGAAAQNYAAKLPGIARQQGLADIKDLSLANQKQLADAVSTLQSQLPQIISDLRNQSDQRAQAKAAAKLQLYQTLTGQNLDVAKFDRAEQDAGLNASTRANAQVQTAQIRARTAAETAQAKAAQTNYQDRLAFARTYKYDPVTKQPLPGYTVNKQGDVVKATKTGAGTTSKPPTANEIVGWVQAWKNGKPASVTVKLPKPDANGNPVYRTVRQQTGKLTFEQAYERLRAAGVPDANARQYLRSGYQRGEQGRSWLTNEEQTTLRSAKNVAPRAHLYKGVAYLDRSQVAALKQAGKVPPGHWIQGSTSTQDLGPIYVIDSSYD